MGGATVSMGGAAVSLLLEQPTTFEGIQKEPEQDSSAVVKYLALLEQDGMLEDEHASGCWVTALAFPCWILPQTMQVLKSSLEASLELAWSQVSVSSHSAWRTGQNRGKSIYIKYIY